MAWQKAAGLLWHKHHKHWLGQSVSFVPLIASPLIELQHDEKYRRQSRQTTLRRGATGIVTQSGFLIFPSDEHVSGASADRCQTDEWVQARRGQLLSAVHRNKAHGSMHKPLCLFFRLCDSMPSWKHPPPSWRCAAVSDGSLPLQRKTAQFHNLQQLHPLREPNRIY